MSRQAENAAGAFSHLNRADWNGLETQEMRRLGTILATQSEVLAMVARGEPLGEVLAALCRLVEFEFPGALCSILLVQGKRLALGAGPSLPEDYACGMDGIEIGEGMGPCGTSAFRREPAIFGDIESSDMLQQFREFMLEHGVKACWSVPFFNAKKTVLGTFAISLPDPLEPEAHQLKMLNTAGALAGLAISRERADEERQRIQKDFMHRQKLESLGVMAGGIAHDFNNLLTAIVGSLSMLDLESGLSEKSRRRIELAKKASAAATDLTTEMLTYSGLASVKLGEVDLAGEVRRVLEVIDPAQGLEGPRFATDLEEGPFRLHGDATQLRQVVQNMVQNAVDATTGRGDCVTVWLRRETLHRGGERVDHSAAPVPAGRYLVLGVQDNGQGIEPEKLGSIFDPFFTSKRSGRGLGLAMVLGGTRAHEGYLHVDSAVGEGTTIQVLFPDPGLPAESPAARMPEDVELPAAQPAALEALLVEDEWSIRELTEDILASEGWRVHSAVDGAERLIHQQQSRSSQ
ncbi:MAG: ATP-binding protein [Acidobacteriota bacterium]